MEEKTFADFVQTVDSLVRDGHIYVSIKSVGLVHDYLMWGLIEAIQDNMLCEPAAVVGLHFCESLKNFHNAILAKHAADIVPDNLKELDGEE